MYVLQGKQIKINHDKSQLFSTFLRATSNRVASVQHVFFAQHQVAYKVRNLIDMRSIEQSSVQPQLSVLRPLRHIVCCKRRKDFCMARIKGRGPTIYPMFSFFGGEEMLFLVNIYVKSYIILLDWIFQVYSGIFYVL